MSTEAFIIHEKGNMLRKGLAVFVNIKVSVITAKCPVYEARTQNWAFTPIKDGKYVWTAQKSGQESTERLSVE